MAKQRTGRPTGRPATPKEPEPPCPSCGGPKRLASAECRSCWRARITKPARDAALAADWRSGGWTKAALAQKYGLSAHRVDTLLCRMGALLPADVLRERKARYGRAVGRLAMGGRPAVWPDCPEHLRDEYMRLRNVHGYRAAEARRMLEGDRA